MPAEKDHRGDEEETSNTSTLGKHALEQENEPTAAEESGMCSCISKNNEQRNSATKTRKTNNEDIDLNVDSDDDIGPMPAAATEETAVKKRKRGTRMHLARWNTRELARFGLHCLTSNSGYHICSTR